MKNWKKHSLIVILVLGTAIYAVARYFNDPTDVQSTELSAKTNILHHVVDLEAADVQLKFYWKDDDGKPIGNARRLNQVVKMRNQKLLFAMNGGMYLRDQSPQGFYVQEGVEHKPYDLAKKGYGNFYMYPNGIFYITKQNKAHVCSLENHPCHSTSDMHYATQSGPMLVIDGKLHHQFIKGSTNLNIRNGVGILPDGKILFAMSKEKINFYDFATFFKDMGCKNALYLDGFVSRTYLPSKKWTQTDGQFGVIIGQTIETTE